MTKGGMRALKDEKSLLAEYAKLFHIARAHARESRNAARSPEAARTAAANSARSAGSNPRPPRRRRRASRGGTVWMTLKGGFARVPTAAEAAKVRRRKVFRGGRSERRRVAALEAAEQYVETAWQEARRAGLCDKDRNEPNGEEGLEYLREQYQVAAGMLRREPVGAHMKRTVEQNCAQVAAQAPVEEGQVETVYDASTWEDVIAREEIILRRFAPRDASGGGDATDAIRQEAAEIGGKYYFDLAEPVAGNEATGEDRSCLPQVSGTTDILPTKCIVRIRSSGKQKHTTILSSLKAVNHFKSNFMQTLRKELSGSKLARGDDATMGSNPQQEANVTGSGKSSKKRH